MRTNTPFGIDPGHPSPGKPMRPPSAASKNFLEIDAKVRTLGHGRAPVEIPFRYEQHLQMFVPQSVHVKWKEAQQLELVITAAYEIRVPVDEYPILPKAYGKGSWLIRQPWDIKFGHDGIVLKAGNLDKRPPKQDDSTFRVTMDGSTSETSEEVPIAEARFWLELSGEYTRGKTQWSASIPHTGIGVSPARDPEQKKYWERYEFAIYALGKDLPPKAISIPPSVLRHNVEFVKGPRDIDVQGAYLEPWIKTLVDDAPELHAAIMAGEVHITLEGQASDTGSDADNVAYSKDRIGAVKEAILDWLGRDGKIFFFPIPWGEKKVTQTGEKTRERRVVITIDRQQAEKMILARRAKGISAP